MGAADGVKTGLLQNADPPELRVPEGAGSQNTVIVMDAGPAQQDFFAVHVQSAAAPNDLPQAKGGLRLI